MKPIGPLMTEHRLIERMVALMALEMDKIKRNGETDVHLLARGVDFFRTYADRTHHGKEEDILFRELGGKQLTSELKGLMNDLIEDHKKARKIISSLDASRKAYSAGNKQSLSDIAGNLGDVATLYPAHIYKEDKQFFYPVLDYLSQEEQDKMLEEFWEFDRKLIHEKYENIVSDLEGKQQ